MLKLSDGLPVLTGNDKKDIQSLADNIFDLRENLQHILTNLDKKNYSADANGIGIHSKVGGDNYTQITQNEDLIQLIAANSEGIASLRVTAGEISSRVEDVNNNLGSRITQTADNINLRVDGVVEDLEENYSTTTEVDSMIDVGLNGITLSSSVSGKTASITISPPSGDPKTADINLTGLVSFTDLSGSGTTEINGGNITTGTISADRIDVDNLIAKKLLAKGSDSGIQIDPDTNGLRVLQINSGDTTTVVGELNYNNTGGLYLSSAGSVDFYISSDSNLVLASYGDLYIKGHPCAWDSNGRLYRTDM